MWHSTTIVRSTTIVLATTALSTATLILNASLSQHHFCHTPRHYFRPGLGQNIRILFRLVISNIFEHSKYDLHIVMMCRSHWKNPKQFELPNLVV